MKIRIITSIAAAALTLAAPLYALAGGDHKPTAGSAAANTELTDAEVRKIDKAGGKVTLKHADIKSLDMPAMTMVFVVKDSAMLDKLQSGDKIRFRAINIGGKFTVTQIEASK